MTVPVNRIYELAYFCVPSLEEWFPLGKKTASIGGHAMKRKWDRSCSAGMTNGGDMRSSTTGRVLKMARFMGNDPLKDLTILEVSKPSPGPGDVLTRITLRPIHRADLNMMRFGFAIFGKLASYAPDPNTEHSNVVGVEGCGIVEKVGEGVENFKPGQRVIPIMFHSLFKAGAHGSWQDYVVTREEDVYPVPDFMDDATAAQFVWDPFAAYMLLKDLDAPKGEYIISTAGGSMMSRVVIQLAKHWGLKTITIARSDVYTEELEALGADVVINSNTQDVVDKVMKLTNGKGAFGAIDAVGGTLTKSIAGCLRDNGQLFIYGYLGGVDVTVSMIDLGRQVKLRVRMSPQSYHNLEQRKMAVEVLMRLFADGTLAPMKSTRRFKFEDWKVAVAAAEQKGTGGDRVLLAD